MKGWICPKCGRVYAPHIDECKHCNTTTTWTCGSCPYKVWSNDNITITCDSTNVLDGTKATTTLPKTITTSHL